MTASSSAVSSSKEGSAAITKVVLTTPELMNLNLSASFIKAVLSSVNALVECSDTAQKIGDSFFIGVRNSTGEVMTYNVLNDNGVTELMRMKVKRDDTEKLDDGIFAGLTNLMVQGQMNTFWCAIHSTSPRLRVYSVIPTETDFKPLFCTDDVTMGVDSEEKIFYPVCSFENVEMFVGNEAMRQEWQKAIQASHSATPIQVQPRVKSMYLDPSATLSLSSHSSVLVTSLPAHPSLTLRYYQKPYRKLQPRTIQLSLENFDPFVCEVDRTLSGFITLDNGATTRDVFIESTIEKGRKILNLCSAVSIQNFSGNDLCCGFGEEVDSSEIAYAEVTPLQLKRNERQWMNMANATGLFLGQSGEMTCCLKLEEILTMKGHRIVNLGSEEAPLFTVLTCRKKMVRNVENKADYRETYLITVADMARMENLLPVPLNYMIISKEENLVQGELGVGEIGSLTQTQLDEDSNYRIALQLKDDVINYSTYDCSISVGDWMTE